MQMHLSETDASLLSWLHALPLDTFSCPFEEKPLKLNMDRFVKPNLEATWADAILATPIKPQQLFPYNAVPTGRSRNTELMSRSLAPQYEGLSFGLSKSQIFTSGIEMKLNPTTKNTAASNKNGRNNSGGINDLNDVTRSIALFNLDTKPGVNQNWVNPNNRSKCMHLMHWHYLFNVLALTNRIINDSTPAEIKSDMTMSTVNLSNSNLYSLI